MSEETPATPVRFDLESLTIGELAEAERASGIDGLTLLRRTANRRLLALFVTELRASRSESSAPRRSWQELESLRLRDG